MSTVTVSTTTWHGFEAMQIESESLKVVVTPGAGGKIVSLYDKINGCEWLVSPEQSHPFRRLEYGTPYNENEPGGWDEMLPTIVAGPYPAPGPWQGQALPDHGEVWTLPWSDAGSGDGRLSLSVVGRALPYRLTRTLTCPATGELSVAYEIENLSAQPMVYLWAAHPQFACLPGSVIELPDDVGEVINVLPSEWGAEWGPAGTHNAWPALPAGDGAVLRQDLIAAPDAHRGRKFYLPPDRPIHWGGLHQPDGCRLRLAWDAAQLPYCGVWIDEGCLNQVSDVAIEPTTGYYDGLALALDNGRASRLEAGEKAQWALTVRVSRDQGGR